MEPLPLKTRRLYSVTFFVLFLIILPVVALYASGYRLNGIELVPTGGIFVAAPLSGFSISLNGEEVERTTLFSKTFFFDNLEANSYVVQVSAEGYYPWSKTLVVEPRVVTDVSALAVLQPLSILEIATSTSATSTEDVASSTVRVVTQDFFETVIDRFATSTTVASSSVNVPPVSTTTNEQVPSVPAPEDTVNGVALVIEDGDLEARYTRQSQPPSSFCVRPSSCVTSFMLERGSETVTDAQFFAGGALYRTLESGVYFVEVETRQPRLTIPVFTTPEARFEVINGALIVESNGTYYEISGF